MQTDLVSVTDAVARNTNNLIPVGGCSYLDSKLFVISIIEKTFSSDSPLKILDVAMGCGELGFFLGKHFARKRDIIIDGNDLRLSFRDWVNDVYRRIQKCDLRDLTVEACRGYDIIVALDCLEHLPFSDSIRALEVLLRTDSHVIVGFPNWRLPQDGEKGGGHLSHIAMESMRALAPDAALLTRYGYACYHFAAGRKPAALPMSEMVENQAVDNEALKSLLKKNGILASGFYVVHDGVWTLDSRYSYSAMRRHLLDIVPVARTMKARQRENTMFLFELALNVYQRWFFAFMSFFASLKALLPGNRGAPYRKAREYDRIFKRIHEID